jgi:phosphatidylinositol-3-phosphatase
MPAGSSGPPSPPPSEGPARPDHIVVVVFENKAANQIDGSRAAPYFNSLMASSAVLTEYRAIAHPSQPNYLALFSGSTQNITDNTCPLNLGDRPNLGRQLIDAGLSFTGYSEGLPSAGYTGCSAGRYAAKHNPWVHFGNLPPTVNQPASAFPADFSTLPTVAFLIPDLCSDMHDCSISTGDSWLRNHLDLYVQWARAHNSLLVVTFDEDDQSAGNRVLTFIVGAGVRPGRYAQPVDHYGLLSTLEDTYDLARLGMAATSPPITGIWP